MKRDYVEDGECNSSFILYSLQKYQLVKQPGSTLTFNSIVVSMTSPPALLVLSSMTFQILHIVPSTSLKPFSPLPHHSTTTSTASSAMLGHHSSQPSPPQCPLISSKPLPLAKFWKGDEYDAGRLRTGVEGRRDGFGWDEVNGWDDIWGCKE
ncbi:hypothetical protein BYT27DRAFT_7254101 [Phlegmacium glaucopus]|nr:hypothetical protein BYT27DRAFT_7254101 [Phlegmacium glaucopus]